MRIRRYSTSIFGISMLEYTLLKRLDFIRTILAHFGRSLIAPFLLKTKKDQLIPKT